MKNDAAGVDDVGYGELITKRTLDRSFCFKGK